MSRAAPARACGGALRKVGEDVTEILDYIPGRFRGHPARPPGLLLPALREHGAERRCRRCRSSAAGRAPGCWPMSWSASTAITCRSTGNPASTPARASISTAPRWPTGSARPAWLLSPLVEAVADHVMAAEKLHADDTPVPVLAPGTGKTKTGRLWVYLRDERPYGGPAPPAVVYRYSPDRKGEHPRAHLAELPRLPAGRRLCRLRAALSEPGRASRRP